MCVAASAAAAPTYRWIDADGLHYSDQPHPGAEIVALGETQTYSATPATPGPAVAAVSERKPKGSRPSEFRYASCAIVQPAKRSSDKLLLSFDGQPIEPASPDQSEFKIAPIDRGTHFAVAIVRDNTGRDLCQSAPVSFHVRQPSALAPGRKH